MDGLDPRDVRVDDASEFDALPKGRDFVGPYVPRLHEPVEFDSVGRDRQTHANARLASD